MGIKNIVLAIILLAGGNQLLNAQTQTDILSAGKQLSVSTNETVFIHANATTFVTGETLLYKMYCLNPADNSISEISKVGYVELVGDDKKSVFRHKLFLANGVGQGDFFVPASLASGNYKLIGYTHWMQNKIAGKVFEISILVINPFESTISQSNSATVTPNKISNAENQGSNQPFTLQPTSNIVSQRGLASLQLSANGGQIPDGNYSLSVRKKDDLPAIRQLTAAEFALSVENKSPIEIGASPILPELRGEIISGHIVSRAGAHSVANRIIALSTQSADFAFKTVKTDDAGRFIIVLENANPKPLIVQLMDENRADFELVLDQPIVVSSAKNLQSAVLTDSLRSSIERRSVASQIENAYFTKKTDSLTTIANRTFFNPAGKVYKLDDYTRFPTLSETVVEVIPEMYYTGSAGNYALHLRDYYSPIKLPDPTLVLVDGLVIQDLDELFEYRMENVDRVTIVPGGYYYGANAFSGIISFTTKNNDYTTRRNGAYKVSGAVSRPLANKIYYKQQYLDGKSNVRIPDYRQQLLWEPNFQTNSTTINFYASDVPGIYEITLQGFTLEGKPVSVYHTIEVK